MTEDLTPLVTARDFVRYAASEFNRHDLFFGHGSDNALDEGLALVIHALELDYNLPDNYLDCRLTANEKKAIGELINQRITTQKPLAYLTGKTIFAGMEFIINESVLVPRSPIAELIQQGYYPWAESENLDNILDLCTGSGCIGIASAAYLPNAMVILSDISVQALAVAEQNIKLHGLQQRVKTVHSDIFNDMPEQKFDLIVSNPPYVSEAEYQALPAEYKNEPRLGLEAGAKGMDIVERILTQARDWLSDHGILIVEVGASAELLMNHYPDIPFNWIEFENGGDGVFVMQRDELEQFR
ncbi:MAG: 50S ribosomal protein L3 N(5)-glutamine methyltransferase [Gammaproteobacteria bacterium]|jgi:ribosomal protein L3 glutamine methyltransferase